MYKIDEIKMLRLGQRDENLAREIQMDASEWLELYPGASIQILFRRPGESTITPMITTLIGTTLTWQINDFEVGITGVGNAEIRAVDVAGLRRKSRIIPCSIEDTLLGDDETVLYTQDQVDVTLANIGQAAESALAAKASEEAAALSASEARESAASAGTAADVAVSARDAAQAAQTAAETAQHQAEAAQSGVHADAVAAEQAKVAAQAAQASAQGSASQAAADKAAAQTAQQAAETAQHAAETAAGNAQASAGAASGSASAAAQSASDAAASAASIGQAEQHAAASAQAAAQSASQAATKATQASQSASQASASVDQAASSATSAAGSATAAAGSATAAQAVLDSIPEDYTALSEDVTDLKSALDFTNGKVFNDIEINFSTANVVTGFISASTGKWTSTGSSYVVPIESANRITITANSLRGSVIALLKTNTIVANTSPDYATGSGREFVDANVIKHFEIPSDAKYVAIMKIAGGNDFTPQEAIVNYTKVASKSDLVYAETIDLENANSRKGLISSDTGNWVLGTDQQGYSTFFIPIPYGEKSVSVKSNTNNASVIAMLTTDAVVPGQAPSYATGCSRTVISTGGTAVFNVPSDAKSLAILHTASGNDYTPVAVEFTRELYSTNQRVDALANEIEKAWQGITHEKPNSIGELNVVRRCRQLTDIKWTPAFDIPRISQLDRYGGGANDPYYFEDVFKAGVEYTGIPYGQANRHAAQWGKDATIGFKIGWEIGFDTFISAVGNAESIVAKDSVYAAATGVHLACFYATVCTALTGYALNLPEYYPTDRQGYAPGMNDLGVVSTVNLEDIHLGDMVWNPTHGGIITDKLRNSDGEIIAIEISEATTIGNADWNIQGSQYGGICRRRMWGISDFAKWANYHLYRYAGVDSTPYTKSPYVDTGNEGNFVRTMNFPVLPYMGENFKYVEGHIPNTKILTPAYKENETDKLRVVKDGEPWNSDGTTDYYDVSGPYVEVGFEETGSYEAYLCKIADGQEIIKTKACHWTVTEPTN